MVVFSFFNEHILLNNLKVGYLGSSKTFTEKATKEILGEVQYFPIIPIRKVVIGVETVSLDYRVVSLDNYYNGEVRETLDSLLENTNTKIIAERSMEIVHCLGALKEHKTIEKILSKDQALEQCSRYLCQFYPKVETIATSSIAQAIEDIIYGKIYDAGVIASKSALESNGLEIIAENICPHNKTRFIVLGKQIQTSSGEDKTFIAIHPIVKDKPGVLKSCLEIFSENDINLESIQSRPDGTDGYHFYIELIGHQDDANVKNAVDRLRKYLDPDGEYNETLRIFGSYVNTHWKL
ncbi:hypothetical protein COU57_04785 [Candidatus Pacearchaeota archaeon CG10_big_fil_rev_8_21_14_0_10_32_14]|nr:MAG: hypothetical protein COU57_04785 [Candidatus Pacearchaeota archaeon CG10_big_fil_rev_8_21_14_0_10_32_14]